MLVAREVGEPLREGERGERGVAGQHGLGVPKQADARTDIRADEPEGHRTLPVAVTDRLVEAVAAGALTAGALQMDIYRTELGPRYSRESLMWCYLAWLVADFVDSVVSRRTALSPGS